MGTVRLGYVCRPCSRVGAGQVELIIMSLVVRNKFTREVVVAIRRAAELTSSPARRFLAFHFRTITGDGRRLICLSLPFDDISFCYWKNVSGKRLAEPHIRLNSHLGECAKAIRLPIYK